MVTQKGNKAPTGSWDRCNSSAESGHTLAFCNNCSQKRAALELALCSTPGAGLLDKISAETSCLVLRAIPEMVTQGNAVPFALDPARRYLGGSGGCVEPFEVKLKQSVTETRSSQIKGFQWAKRKTNSV